MMEILEQIPLGLEIEEVKSRLHGANEEQIQTFLEVARPFISARAVFKTSYIDEKLENAVIIDGVRFKSQVLRKNLEKVGRVFPYVVTIGGGLEQKSGACKDLLEQYYLDAIGNVALREARQHLENHLRSRFALGGVSYMSPGSLGDWPIQEQRPLFSLLKGAEESIGVRLNESLLMIPRKSVSGLYFPTEVTFYNCQLCPRQNCEGRKAPYSESLAKEYGLM